MKCMYNGNHVLLLRIRTVVISIFGSIVVSIVIRFSFQAAVQAAIAWREQEYERTMLASQRGLEQKLEEVEHVRQVNHTVKITVRYNNNR